MKPFVKISLLAITIVGLSGIFAGVYLFNEQHLDLRSTAPDFEISATGLQKAFDENEADAASKYVNRIIEVTGTVQSVKSGEQNIASISLQTGSIISSVICTFVSKSDLSGLVPGIQVKVRGECSGFLMDVLLNNCVLIK